MQAVADLVGFRRETALAQARFASADTQPKVLWLHPRGGEMTEADWHDEGLAAFGLHLTPGEGSAPLIILCNAADDARFLLPKGRWIRRIDSAKQPIRCVDPVEGEIALARQSVQVFIADHG